MTFVALTKYKKHRYMGDKARLFYPSPRGSNGCIDGYADIKGGEPLQDNISGNKDGAVFAVVAGGTTGKQIVIPAAFHGGVLVNVRGAFSTTAVPRYDSWSADFNQGDTTNYADFTAVAVNRNDAGVLSTTIPILSSVALGTQLQVYYSYQTGQFSIKGQAMAGYPMLHIDPYQGTANDGDNYLIWSLYHAYNTTKKPKFKLLADKICAGIFEAGRWSTNKMNLALDISLEAGQDGLYWYNSDTTPFAVATVPRPDNANKKCLQITTTVNEGNVGTVQAPKYNYAGFGNWFSFPVTADSPFHSLDFLLVGDGSNRYIELSSNISPTNAADGDVSVLIPLSPFYLGGMKKVQITASDLWKSGNVIYDSAHKDYANRGMYILAFSGATGTNTTSITQEFDAIRNRVATVFRWDFSPSWNELVGTNIAQNGYAGIYFSPPNQSSAGTTAFNFDLFSKYAGALSVTYKDTNLVAFSVTINATAGWQSISVVWDIAAVHPITALSIEPVKTLIAAGYNKDLYSTDLVPVYLGTVWVPAVYSTMTIGELVIDNARYDAVQTMANLSYSVINGFQFKFPSNASGIPYVIKLAEIEINQTVIDGTPADPMRYQGIPRWTYKWAGKGENIGFGSWRGCSAVGYNWLAGWTYSGFRNPDNGRLMSDQMRDFFYDSFLEFKNQFPAQPYGTLMPRYGRVSWEALGQGGYVSGVWTDSTYRKWYYPDTDDWYGYHIRAWLSIAGDYYATQNATSKTMLDAYMQFLENNITSDGTGGWNTPSVYGKDGIATHTYNPVYNYACMAGTCIYKYWVDGDPIALKWARRLLDHLYNFKRQTAKGTLLGVSKVTEGSDYLSAIVLLNGDGSGAEVTANIYGGRITSYNVVSQGSGYTWITADIVTSAPTWDISSATYTSKFATIGTQDTSPAGMCFSANGMRFYLIGQTTKTIYQYDLTTAWDVSTATYAYKSFSVAAQDSIPWGIFLSPSGLKLYVSGQSNHAVFEYSLSAAWDISTATYFNKSLDCSVNGRKPRCVVLDGSGTKIFVAGYSNDTIYQFNLSVAWDITTAVFFDSLWVGDMGSGYPIGLMIKPDGTKLYFLSEVTKTIYQYTFASAWNITTASYASLSFLANVEDSTPSGLYLHPSGLGFYVMGQTNDKMYQYDLSVVGGGSGNGAVCNPYLSDRVYGLYDANHTGWEVAEIYNTIAMLVLGARKGGVCNHPITATGADYEAFELLNHAYRNNRGESRPNLINTQGIPWHEYDIDPYHKGAAFENPMIKDTHVSGATWTESIAPTFYAAVEYYRWSGDTEWMESMFKALTELADYEELDFYE